MEINFGNNGNFDVSKFANGTGGVQGSVSEKSVSSGKSAVSRDFGNMTITRASVSAEEIEAAGIPDEALLRDDSLGNLIGKAFNLPPPPMPSFQS